MKNLSRHTDLLCELETSWLIGLVKHVMWADSLYFLYLLLHSISKILATSQPTL
jgi:hypothetical protein